MLEDPRASATAQPSAICTTSSPRYGLDRLTTWTWNRTTCDAAWFVPVSQHTHTRTHLSASSRTHLASVPGWIEAFFPPGATSGSRSGAQHTHPYRCRWQAFAGVIIFQWHINVRNHLEPFVAVLWIGRGHRQGRSCHRSHPQRQRHIRGHPQGGCERAVIGRDPLVHPAEDVMDRPPGASRKPKRINWGPSTAFDVCSTVCVCVYEYMWGCSALFAYAP